MPTADLLDAFRTTRESLGVFMVYDPFTARPQPLAEYVSSAYTEQVSWTVLEMAVPAAR